MNAPDPAPGLAEALDVVFAAPEPPAPQALAGFARALTAAQAVTLIAADGALLAMEGREDEDAAREAGRRALASGRAARVGPERVAAPVTLGDGAAAALVARMPKGAATAMALAHERLELLSRIAGLRWRGGAGLQALLGDAAAAARGEVRAARRMLEAVAARWGAGAAALVATRGRGRLILRGRGEAARRAAAPAALRARARAALDGEAPLAEGVAPLGARWALVLIGEGAAAAPAEAALLDAVWRGAQARPGLGARLAPALRLAVPLALLTALMALPVEDAASLPAQLHPASTRIATAPFDGRLLRVAVRPGDAVIAGETVLFEMDDGALALERARLVAEEGAAALERERARGLGDAARAHAAEIALKRARLRLEALDAKIADAVQLAPISGEVTGADPTRLDGAYVGLGAAVVEIADPAALILRARIAPAQRARLDVGDALVFHPDFAPETAIETRVAHIGRLPAEGARDGARLVASAPFPARDGMTPGVSGAARGDARQAPLGLLLWERLRDWALLRFWL